MKNLYEAECIAVVSGTADEREEATIKELLRNNDPGVVNWFKSLSSASSDPFNIDVPWLIDQTTEEKRLMVSWMTLGLLLLLLVMTVAGILLLIENRRLAANNQKLPSKSITTESKRVESVEVGGPSTNESALEAGVVERERVEALIEQKSIELQTLLDDPSVSTDWKFDALVQCSEWIASMSQLDGMNEERLKHADKARKSALSGSKN